MAKNDASYDVLELSAMSYAQTSANLGLALDGSAPFTIDAWLKLDGLCASASILSQEGAFSFGVAGESVTLEITRLPPVVSDPSLQPLTAIDWHHVAVTFVGGQVRLYIDGQFNTLETVNGTGPRSSKPFRIGLDLQASVSSLRVFDVALPGSDIKKMMFEAPPDGVAAVADFDFSVTPPVDRGAGHLPIVLEHGARMMRRTPALALNGTAFAEPLADQHINPGGQQVDPYTVQAWIIVGSASSPRQAVFVNSDLESQTGMAFYLDYDAAAAGFRVVSQRGSNLDRDSLVSTALVEAGSWTNVATTFDGTRLTIYVNGQEAGSGPFPPIPLDSTESRLMIGAAHAAGRPFGAMTLQGHVSRLEVWSRALSAAEIATFMARSPDRETPGLEADYDFTTERARNVLDAHPVGLADGAALEEQSQPATPSSSRTPSLSPSSNRAAPPIPVPGITEETLRELIASISSVEILRDCEADLRTAMAADIEAFAAGPAPADAATVAEAWQEVLDLLRADPASLPFFVTSHVVDGRHVVLCHRRGRTHVAFTIPVGTLDDCTIWAVTLIFIVVAGLFDAFFGLSVRLTDRAIAYLTTALRRPQIVTLLAAGSAVTATQIFDMAKAFYTYGILGELLSMIVELSFWAALRVAAKLALKLVGLGALDVIASLVATAGAFIVEYSRKPDDCHVLPMVDLSGIKFDYDPTATAMDALTIRHNYATAVPVVQWSKRMSTAQQSPAAYAITRVAGKEVTIQAGFVATEGLERASVKAEGGGVLGAVDPFVVTFTHGQSDPQFTTISLKHHTLAAGGVQKQDIEWKWFYQLPGRGWLPLATTKHRIYVVLDTPRLPWQQPPGAASQQTPWAEVLDFACAWATGATTAAEAAAAITTHVNASAGLVYSSESQYTVKPAYERVFLCTRFLDLLRGGPGNGNKVNCVDCASIVTTFANSLGCDLMSSRMKPATAGGFYCNKIQTIGDSEWEYPFPDGNRGFAFHEVAWTGLASYTDPLYDACLKVDGGPDPWNWTDPAIEHSPTLAAGMVFTTFGSHPSLPISTPLRAMSYRERLATNAAGGIGACVPRGAQAETQNGRRRVM